MKQSLIVMVGLPRAGKSTRARELGWPIVGLDSIRLALHGQRYQALTEPYVWAIAHTMVRSLLLSGHMAVILDATNILRKRRDEWRYDRTGSDIDVRFLHVDTAADVCLGRAVREGDSFIIPVINRMAQEWEPLSEDEPRYEVSQA